LRVGLISDLHGNLAALEAVLAELEQESPDELVCLGDIPVGPQPSQTLARVRELGCPVVQGNWDAWYAEGIPDLKGEHGRKLVEQGEWWKQELSPDDLDYLGSLPLTLDLSLGGGELLCFHGSPRSHMDPIHVGTADEELGAMLEGHEETILAGGHTHAQLIRPHGRSLVVNPGSVGLPFEGWPPSGETRVLPWAEYAVVEVDDGGLRIDLRRVDYDVAGLLRLVLESGVPHARWWVDCWVLD
jgi:putative phosphoesterase